MYENIDINFFKLCHDTQINISSMKTSISTTTKDWSVIIVDVAESPIERPKKR